MKIYQLTKLSQNEALSKHKTKELTYYNYNDKKARVAVKDKVSSKGLIAAFFDNKEFEMPLVSVGFIFNHKQKVGEGKEKTISYFYRLESQNEYDQAVVKGQKLFFVHSLDLKEWYVTEMNPAQLVPGVPEEKQKDNPISSSSSGQYTQINKGDTEPKSPTTPSSSEAMPSAGGYVPTPGETPGNPSSSVAEHKEGSSFSWGSLFNCAHFFGGNNSAKTQYEKNKQKMEKQQVNDLVQEDVNVTPGAPPPAESMLPSSSNRKQIDDGVAQGAPSTLIRSPSK